MSIYVGNLSYDVTQDDLNAVFAEYGTVKRVQLPLDRETGRPRGFGFVEMSTEAEETAAIEALDGAEWMGRDLRVNKAKPREERSNSGGSRGRDGGNRFSNSWGNSGGGGGGGGGSRGYSRY
jgi:RNA recognition motif-containing protein